jgi:hypothetical protein
MATNRRMRTKSSIRTYYREERTMPTTDRCRVASRVGTLLVMLNFCGFLSPAHPADRRSLVVAPDRVPFELSRNSVENGVLLKIGDLSVVSETEASALMSDRAIDDKQIEECLQAGPTWLRQSDDGTTLELLSPWDKNGSRATAALCEEGIILVGGYVQRSADDTKSGLWLFAVGPGGTGGPTISIFSPPHFADKTPAHGRYMVYQVRAIDRESVRILFRAVAENGEDAFLAAPFVLVSAAAGKR